MAKLAFLNAGILIVDDELANVRLLEKILQNAGYSNVFSTTNPHEVFPLFVERQPDLILLDLMMPEMNGFEVMERLSYLIPGETFLPILILTANVTSEAKNSALAGGATDFLTKPLDQTEVLLRIANLLATRLLHRTMEERVRERTAQVAQSQMEILQRLARAGEFRDDDTGKHTQRVGHTSVLLAQQLGLSPEQSEFIRQAAPLHDIGKIGISDLILLKPGKLTDAEFTIIKTHAEIGASLLAGGDSALLQTAEHIAGTHHEKWDGSGYPNRLKGEEIPIEGRIVAIVDVFDALTHERPYKKAWSIEEALVELRQQSGRHFDPQVVEAFLKLPHEELI